MNADYVTGREADQVIGRWASRGTNVVLAQEIGDLAVFVQRRGEVELLKPGLAAHKSSSGDCTTTVFASRFGEVVHVEDDAHEMLLLRRPAGASGLEIALIADFAEELQPEDVLLLVQVSRGVRPPVQ